jgi:hypothetical protein
MVILAEEIWDYSLSAPGPNIYIEPLSTRMGDPKLSEILHNIGPAIGHS